MSKARIEITDNKHDLALFNTAVDRNLLGCDPVGLKVRDVLSAGPIKDVGPFRKRQYARIMREWVTPIGLEPSSLDAHAMRRTKVAQICKKTGILCAVHLLYRHSRIDSTVRQFVDLDDALNLSERIQL